MGLVHYCDMSQNLWIWKIPPPPNSPTQVLLGPDLVIGKHSRWTKVLPLLAKNFIHQSICWVCHLIEPTWHACRGEINTSFFHWHFSVFSANSLSWYCIAFWGHTHVLVPLHHWIWVCLTLETPLSMIEIKIPFAHIFSNNTFLPALRRSTCCFFQINLLFLWKLPKLAKATIQIT